MLIPDLIGIYCLFGMVEGPDNFCHKKVSRDNVFRLKDHLFSDHEEVY